MDMDTEFALTQITAAQSKIQQDITLLRKDIVKALTHLEVLDSKITAFGEIQKDHEVRMRLLERFHRTVLGFAIMSNAATGFAGYWIAHLLR
jgi:hypothetical protein